MTREPESMLRSYGNGPDIDSFAVKNMNRHTFLGKLFEYNLNSQKKGIEKLKSIRNRRLVASIYSYDYWVYAERGIFTEVQKKMWHGGWGRLVNWSPRTTIGYHGIVFEEEIDSKLFQPSIFSDTFCGLKAINAKNGLALDIVNENFMLDHQDKFAFYSFLSGKTVTMDKINEVANALKQVESSYSFDRLKRGNNTNCVGFIIDVPSDNKRYTYITGTHRWSPGSRQLKLIDKTNIEIDYKNLAVSAGVLIIEGIKIFTDKNSTANYFPQTVKSATKNAAIAKAASDFVKSFELKKPKTQVAGSAYAYTQDGSGYCGMIMYRQRF